jgi:7-keto-8-aminopelargonate synthetase-like enzyme
MGPEPAGEQAVAVGVMHHVARVTPAMVRQRAMTVAQRLMSAAVYPTTVDCPVVPEEACTRMTSSMGVAKSPKG